MTEMLLGWVGLSVLLALTTEVGYRLNRWARRKPPETDEGVAYLLTAVLGLLGLLIAFVFSLAAERYETRRALVVEEANAISTTFLRQQLLPEPHRTVLTGVMADYVKARLAFFDAGDNRGELLAAEARTDALQARIWAATGAAIRTPEGAQIVTPLLGATNEMFDLASSRHAAFDARVPGRTLRVLIIYAFCAAAIMGYSLAVIGRRHLIPSAGLFALVALAISLILDLDSPRRGAVRVPQAPIEHVSRQVLDAAPRR